MTSSDPPPDLSTRWPAGPSPDWTTRSLADPALAQTLLDLFVTERDRAAGALAALLCSAEGQLLQPVLLTDLDLGAPPRDRRLVLDCLGAWCRADPGGEALPVVVALVHPEPHVTDQDRSWHQSVIEHCRRAAIPLLGAYVVVPGRVHPLPGARQAA